MIKFTAKDVRDVLRKELREYEVTLGYMTPEERVELHGWVAEGNHAICNPWHMAGDDGYPLDYITAIRIVEDMLCNPDDYNFSFVRELCDDEADGELPL
jgi:hypothetical protein